MKCRVGLLLLTLLVAHALATPSPAAAQTRKLPRQTIVFAIDNSGSMAASDPLNLRGVAASLVLDAAELASDVEAGLVFFSTRAETVGGKLHPTDYVRERLQAGNLPRADGATDMAGGLRRALALAASAGSEFKKVVLITDGNPDDGRGGGAEQVREILDTLVPQAVAAGVQIYALGLTDQIDGNFLTQVTDPTGGRTVISRNHGELLQGAKELVGDIDNVFTLAHEELASTEPERAFELPPGVDLARLTVLLKTPDVFASHEIDFEIVGPDSGDGGTRYFVRKDGYNRVAAWTTFLNTPGTYTLRTAVHKPGVIGHQGLHLFLEALSILDVEAALRPDLPCYTFGDEVRMAVQAATASGSLDVASLRLHGVVRTDDGGSQTVSFQGGEGRFEVPDVAGTHRVEVTAETSEKLARKTVSHTFRACPPEPIELRSSRPELEFQEPLSGEDADIEQAFKLSADRPSGSRPGQVKFSVVVPPVAVGRVELLTGDGARLKTDGTSQYVLPADGLDLVLHVLLEPGRIPGPEDAREHRGELRFASEQAGADLVVPFVYPVRILEFELADVRRALSLWWDPERPRKVRLGRVRSDLRKESTFTVFIPESIHVSGGGPKVADLSLQVGEETPDAVPAGGGAHSFGPFDLPPGEEVPVDLLLTPDPSAHWEELPSFADELKVRLESSYGMTAEATPTYFSLGPWAAVPEVLPRSFHARPWFQLLLVGGALLLFAGRTWSRIGEARRFLPFRVGALCPLGSGDLRIGDADEAGAAALVLPGSGSDLDGATLGRVAEVGQGQEITDLSRGKLLVDGAKIAARRRLRYGDTLAITDPAEPGERLWELGYEGYEADEGGQVEVLAAPRSVSRLRIAFGIAAGVALLFALAALAGSGWVAWLAYHVPFIERLYAAVFA